LLASNFSSSTKVSPNHRAVDMRQWQSGELDITLGAHVHCRGQRRVEHDISMAQHGAFGKPSEFNDYRRKFSLSTNCGRTDELIRGIRQYRQKHPSRNRDFGVTRWTNLGTRAKAVVVAVPAFI
jgi:hypothetical protein